MSFWAGVLATGLVVGAIIVFLVALIILIAAIDLHDPRAWLARRKHKRLTRPTPLPAATARQIKRARLASRAELDAIEMPRLSRGEVPPARSDFGKGPR